jgi:hypothetical protein
MPKRLRSIIDSILYAGLRPAGSRAETKPQPPRGFLDRWLSGSKPADPLYLTNRTVAQKVRLALTILIPVALAGLFIAVALSHRFTVATKPAAEPGRAEASKKLDALLQDIKVESRNDVVVEEVQVRRGSPSLVSGFVRNNTDHVVRSAELVFDLADMNETQLGSASTTVKDLAPKSTANFEFPVAVREAVMATVREVNLH